jgi:cardiolipin synthase
MDYAYWLKISWIVLCAVVTVGVELWAICHVLLYNRNTRASIAWVGLIFLAPIIGPLVYFSLGINRIQRKGQELRANLKPVVSRITEKYVVTPLEIAEARENYPNYYQLANMIETLTGSRLLPSNSISPLVGGDEAFPEMLKAIQEAKHSVAMCSYIFDVDRAGEAFVTALADAKKRGVEVRVLVDDVGIKLSWPKIHRVLAKHGVPCERFLKTFIPRPMNYSNLRNHRKILVVDGALGFTGGMNIREGNQLGLDPSHPIQDVHFRIEGPVVTHLMQTFYTDWMFTTNEALSGDAWFPEIEHEGLLASRGIADGPDEDFDVLHLALLGAIGLAQKRIDIVTPYFLPDSDTIAALNIASLRGVEVNILLPEKNNIRLVQWAGMALFDQLLERNCRIYLTPAPFDHTKVMLVDDAWSLIGSSNWDPRSLRLNFEFNLECYGSHFLYELRTLVNKKIEGAWRLTLDEVHRRGRLVRLRDAVARLFTPYL